MVIKLGVRSLRRVWGKPCINKIDTNYICEERGLLFDTKSIFVLHELLFMIPVYNEKYHDEILNINFELLKHFGVDRKEQKVKDERNIFFEFLNKTAFTLQYLYMFIRRHSPDYQRLLGNNAKGRIEFFPKDFEAEKLKKYEESLIEFDEL